MCSKYHRKMKRKNRRERFWRRLAWKLPKSLIYWSTVRLGGYAFSRLGTREVSSLTLLECLEVWETGVSSYKVSGSSVSGDVISEIQSEMVGWLSKNFPDQSFWHPLLGMVEEVGELSHHVLKREQKVRNDEDHDSEIVDALGDIIIYMINFSVSQNINLSEAIRTTWSMVRKRQVGKGEWS